MDSQLNEIMHIMCLAQCQTDGMQFMDFHY